MAPKNWTWIAIGVVLVIASYQVGKYAGQNSAQARSREKQLAFQRDMEETRKAEFAKLLRIQEEEKRAAEIRRRREKTEERTREALKVMDESADREMALLMKCVETIQNGP